MVEKRGRRALGEMMFGYVTPLKDELKMREFALYQAYDCGLCKAIGARYGQLPRLALSYDCVFLALLVAGCTAGVPCRPGRCVYKPWKKRPIAPLSPALEFAADANVLLSYYQALDAWQDERSAKGLGGRALLTAAARHARTLRPGLDQTICRNLANLNQLEQERCPELDAAAEAFGRLLAAVVEYAPVEEEREKSILLELARELGRWIYWMDAWEDRQRDEKSGAYNPFLLAGAGEERAAFLLRVALNRVRRAYELMDLESNQGVLDNILYNGLERRTQAVLGGVEHKGGFHEQSL